MLKNYLKIAFRNLWKNKGYTVVNMAGLSIGLTGFILLLLYVNYEHSYDKWSPQLKYVYQVNEFNTFSSSDPEGAWNDQCDTRIGPLLREHVAGIQGITMVDAPYDFSLGIEAERNIFLESCKTIRDADSSFFDVFPYHFIAGNPNHALDKIHSMVITESTAQKWFGSTDVIGNSVKLKRWWRDQGVYYEITGVVRDLISPTAVSFGAIYRSGENDKGLANPNHTHFAQAYARFDANQNPGQLETRADKVYNNALGKLLQQRKTSLADYMKSGKKYGIRFQQLQYAHLHPVNAKNMMDRIAPALALSLLLLLIAIINFANLATAQVVQRGKEAGVRKVLGAGKKALITQFLIEVGAQCLISVIVALLAVELCLPFFNHFFDITISLWNYHHTVSTIWWQVIIIVLTTIFLSGIYPAFFLAGYDPVKVLKGNFSRGGGGIAVRNILIIVQFLIAAVFITGILIIKKQVNYMAHADLGFQPSGLINLKVTYDKQLYDRLKAVPGVEYVGTNSQLMGNSMDFMNKIKYNGEKINLNVASVTMETFNAMQVDLLTGRLFSPRYGQDTVNTVILNQSAARLLGGDVIGKSLYENDSLQKYIVGIIADYHYEGFDKKVLPTIYALRHSNGPSADMNNMLVRVNLKNHERVIEDIKKIWASLYPGYPLQYVFVKDSFSQLIADDIRFRKIVGVFTLMALFLSLVGIFALSAFITARRIKEISIRKILGASFADILGLLNKSFVQLVIIANVLAWPLAYLLVKHWLNGFAYRIDIPIMPFMAAMILSIVLTILTVSFQSWKAIKTNPADALKYE